MKVRPLILALLLAGAALALARTLVTQDGVGALEYVVGIALLMALGVGAFRAARRAIGAP
jgi:hypothetical protein